MGWPPRAERGQNVQPDRHISLTARLLFLISTPCCPEETNSVYCSLLAQRNTRLHMGAILSQRSQAVLQLLIGMQNRAMGILGPLKWRLVTIKGRQRKEQKREPWHIVVICVLVGGGGWFGRSDWAYISKYSKSSLFYIAFTWAHKQKICIQTENRGP